MVDPATCAAGKLVEIRLERRYGNRPTATGSGRETYDRRSESHAAAAAAPRAVKAVPSPSYFAANGFPKSPRDLQKLSFITFEALNSATSWSFGNKKSEALAIRSRLSVNTAEAAIDAATAGVGVTRVLSYQAAQAIADGKLQVVLSSFEPAPVPVSMIYAKQNLLPLKTRSFIDFAAPRLRERLSQIADCANA
jgi:DNA-binding transcriptional LysR family regulator